MFRSVTSGCLICFVLVEPVKVSKYDALTGSESTGRRDCAACKSALSPKQGLAARRCGRSSPFYIARENPLMLPPHHFITPPPITPSDCPWSPSSELWCNNAQQTASRGCRPASFPGGPMAASGMKAPSFCGPILSYVKRCLGHLFWATTGQFFLHNTNADSICRNRPETGRAAHEEEAGRDRMHILSKKKGAP